MTRPKSRHSRKENRASSKPALQPTRLSQAIRFAIIVGAFSAGALTTVAPVSTANAGVLACPSSDGFFNGEERGLTLGANPCVWTNFNLSLDVGQSVAGLEVDEPGVLEVAGKFYLNGGSINIAGAAIKNYSGIVPAAVNINYVAGYNNTGALYNSGDIGVGRSLVGSSGYYVGSLWGYDAQLNVRQGAKLINNVDGRVEVNTSTLRNAGQLVNNGNLLPTDDVYFGFTGGRGLLIGLEDCPTNGTCDDGERGTLTNTSTGLLQNNGLLYNLSGTVNNSGSIFNSGRFYNYNGGELQTGDTFLAYVTAGVVRNTGNFSNSGTLKNQGHFRNYGLLGNDQDGTIDLRKSTFAGDNPTPTLTTFSGGGISNSGTITLTDAFLDLKAGSRLINRFIGTIINFGGSSISNAGTLDNYGTLSNSLNADLLNSGTLTNSGTLNNSQGGRLTNSGTLTNTSTGTLNNTNLGVLINEDQLINSGTLSNSSLLVNIGTLTNTGTIDNDGILALWNGGTFSNGSSGILNLKAGSELQFGYAASFSDFFYNNGAVNEEAGRGIRILNGGELSVESGRVWFNVGPLTVDSGGVLRNSGFLINSASLNLLAGSTLNNSTGVLSLNANSTLNIGNTLSIGSAAAGTIFQSAGRSISVLDGGRLSIDTAWDNVGPLGINAGGELTNNATSLNNLTTISVGGTLTNNGTLNNADTLINQYAQSSISNLGTLTNQSGGQLFNSGRIDNNVDATLVNQSGATLSNDVRINNRGTLNNAGTLVNRLFSVSNLSNTGTLTNQSGGTIDNYGVFGNAFNSTLINEPGGSLTNRYGGVMNNSGSFENAGTLTNQSAGILRNFYGATLTNSGTVDNAGTLYNESTLTNNGTINLSGRIRNYGTLTNNNTLTLNYGSSLFSLGVLNLGGSSILEVGTYLAFTNVGTINETVGRTIRVLDRGVLSIGKLWTNAGPVAVEAGGTLAITSGGTVQNFGSAATLINDGAIENSGLLVNSTRLDNNASFTNRSGGLLFNQGAGQTLTNNGMLTNEAGGSVTNRFGGTLQNAGTFMNAGSLYNSPDGTLANTGTLNNINLLTNRGTLDNSGTLALASGSTFDNSAGVLNLRSSGVLELGNAVTVSGFFDNNGTVNEEAGRTITVLNGGALSVDRAWNNEGTINVRGNLNNLSGSTLINQGSGTIINDGTLENSGVLLNVVRLDNNASFTNRSAGTLLNQGGGLTLTNNGTLTNEAGGSITNRFGGTLQNIGALTNAGWFSNTAGSTLATTGTLNNINSLTNDGTLDNSGAVTSTGSINGAGTFNQTAGSLTVNGTMVQDDININGGSVFGSGSIESAQGVLIGADATLNPGTSIGDLVIIGDLELDGTLNMEIESLFSFDTLAITGILDLTSATDTLTIDWLGGYVPTLGDSFDLVTAETITGEFDIFNWAFGLPQGFVLELDYRHNLNGIDILTASVSSVPIPGAIWLFGSGLLGLIGVARHKKRPRSV